MNNLGMMYVQFEQYESAETYFIMAIEKNNSNALTNLEYSYYKLKKYDKSNKEAIKTGLCCYDLGLSYYLKKKYELAEKYFLMAIRKDNSDAMNKIGQMYTQHKKYDLAEKYLLMGIGKNNISSMNNLRFMYYLQKQYEKAKKYCLMAIEMNNIYAMNTLGNIYIMQKNYDLAEKYYLIAIKKGEMHSLTSIGCLYQKENKYKLAEKYFLMSIEKNNPSGIKLLERLYINNILKLYFVLKNAKNINKLIDDKINELKKNENIICYENNINFLSKIGECPICLETTKLIPRRCAHFYCYSCFVEITKCSICRI